MAVIGLALRMDWSADAPAGREPSESILKGGQYGDSQMVWQEKW
jgi:hypothetical protein